MHKMTPEAKCLTFGLHGSGRVRKTSTKGRNKPCPRPTTFEMSPMLLISLYTADHRQTEVMEELGSSFLYQSGLATLMMCRFCSPERAPVRFTACSSLLEQRSC